MKRRGDEEDMRTERKRDSLGFPEYINYLAAAFFKCKEDTVSAMPHHFSNYCILRHAIITKITVVLCEKCSK